MTEQVLAHEPRSLHRISFSDPESSGELETRFEIARGERTTVSLELTYSLAQGGPFAWLAERFFVRGQVAKSLRRTLLRFRLEVEELAAMSPRPTRRRAPIASLSPALTPLTTSEAPNPMFVFKAAVVGAGTMGGEIAQAIASSDIPVVLKDIDQKFVDHGLEKAREVTKGQLDRLVKKEKLTQEQADARLEEVMGLIEGTTSYESFGDVDFVIEAAPEKMEIKRRSSPSSTRSRPATRSSPPTPRRSRSPRWATRPCGRTRSSASTSSTRRR